MWIKHRNTLYNSDNIISIEPCKYKIIATFVDGSKDTIGEFWTYEERKNIFRNITKSLTNNDPFIVIKDTRDGCKKL